MINKYFLTKMNIPAYLKKFLYDRYGGIEIEGIPPITFQGNGKYLLDYIIYGASGGVGERTKNLFNEITYQGGINNVGNITDSTTRIRSEYIDVDENETYTCSSNLNIRIIYAYNNEYNKVGCIYDAAQGEKVVTFVMPIGATKIMISFMDVDNPNNEITPNDFLWGQLEKGSTATAYEPYGYKVPIVISGKNVLKNTETSKTKNGITFTMNEDKSIVMNGTATSSVNLYINLNLELDAGEYYLSCKCEGEFTANPLIIARNFGNYTYTLVNNQVNLSVTEKNGQVILQVANGTTINAILYPMIRKADITDDTYEPYIEPTTTNIYLDEPIGENESISLSDTNTNIPTIKGTNILSFETTVQPSKVLIKV